jgi:hypothetical protein
METNRCVSFRKLALSISSVNSSSQKISFSRSHRHFHQSCPTYKLQYHHSHRRRNPKTLILSEIIFHEKQSALQNYIYYNKIFAMLANEYFFKCLFILLIIVFVIRECEFAWRHFHGREKKNTPRHRKYLNRLSQRNLSISVIVCLAASHGQVNFPLSSRAIIA